MAGFLGGALPILSVSAAVLSNNFRNSFTDQVINTGLGVALSPTLGAKLSQSLGLNTTSGTNPLAGLASQGLGITQQTINQFVGNAVSQSGIAGPFANLLTRATQLGVRTLGQNVSSLLSSANASGADRAFPGAGDEPDANYQGSAYSINGGPDVVFSILPATTTAQFDGFAQITGLNTPSKLSPFEVKNLSFAKGVASSVNFSGFDLSSNTFGTPEQFAQLYSLNLTTAGLKVGSPADVNFATPSAGGWTFICAPQDVSWDVSAQVARVDIFGTNTPPVISGTKGMRNLNLSSSIVEGFSRGKAVEDKIIQLEKLINFSLSDKGFVNVPVYYVTANNKKYGDADGGYFIIKDIKVKEAMRDLSGRTTRAVADVSFVQVPEYQVDTGVDQASKVQTGAKSSLVQIGQDFASRANKGTTTPASRSGSSAPSAPTPGGSARGTNRSGASKGGGLTGLNLQPYSIRQQINPTP